MILHRLTDRLSVSDAPTEHDLAELAAQGFRTIVDLRAEAEPRPRGLAPSEEEKLAARAGLAYRQIPIEPPRLAGPVGTLVRQALRQATPPVLLHCTTGRRAGVFGLLAVACEDGSTVETCLERGRSMGLDFEGMPRLTAFLKEYLARHRTGEVGVLGARIPVW
jgi:uncharacterized protein (TIGR01244 family)